MRIHLRSAVRWPAMLIAVLLLASCGFQPRGQAPGQTTLPDPIAITGIRVNSPLHRELRTQILAADGTVVEQTADSAVVLRINKQQSQSRVLSVDSRNKAVEYELEESARFTLQASDGSDRVPAQTVRVLRILFRPRDSILSGDREEELLRADMRRELVSRMLQRLRAAG